MSVSICYSWEGVTNFNKKLEWWGSVLSETLDRVLKNIKLNGDYVNDTEY